MKKRRIRDIKNTTFAILNLITLTAVGVMLVALGFSTRGENVVGGEVFLFAVPFLVWFGLRALVRSLPGLSEKAERARRKAENTIR